VDDPDLKDSVHDAPNLRDSSPPIPFLVVQGIEPLLDFKRLDVLCDLVAPLGNQEVANVVVKNGLRVLRLRSSPPHLLGSALIAIDLLERVLDAMKPTLGDRQPLDT
jgi:hypothetical protein